MEKGQHPTDLIMRVNFVYHIDALLVGGQVMVAEHHALGCACTAGRKQDGGDAVRVHILDLTPCHQWQETGLEPGLGLLT